MQQITVNWRLMIVGGLIVLQSGLLVWSGAHHYPTTDERAHLPAGISHWQFGSFDLYRVNPPLVRTLAALPVVVAGPETDWSRYHQGVRPEFGVAKDFLDANGYPRVFWYFAIARWGCLPLIALGAWATYSLGTTLYGPNAGIAGLVAWCFSPTVLAYGATIMPDAGAAAIGVAAILFIRKWLITGSWGATVNAGIWIGLANLAKSTWLVLFVVCAMLWGLGQVLLQRTKDQRSIGSAPGTRDHADYRPRFSQLVTVVVVALSIINLGYGFEGTLKPLGQFAFVSELFGGAGAKHGRASNRFEGSSLEDVPVPLPKHYVEGIDYLRREFEIGRASYLNGQWRHGGWWYYYLYAILVKVPIGLLALAAATVAITIWEAGRRCLSRQELFDEVVLLAPAVGVLVLVSSQTGFNHHLRYVLPAFPFLFVWIGKLGKWFEPMECGVRNAKWGIKEAEDSLPLSARWMQGLRSVPKRLLVKRALVVLMLGWAIVSSCTVYPHSHSYFNEFAGGSANGWKQLHFSNVDWGEDLTYLKDWLDEHPEATEIGIAAFGGPDLEWIGVDFFEPNRWPAPAHEVDWPSEQQGPQPGWYAISLCRLAGEPADSFWRRPSEEYPNDPSRSYFRYFEPIETIGYSMNIYHVTLEECNRVRRNLGLKELPRDWSGNSRAEGGEPER